jgi:hypothetical protein
MQGVILRSVAMMANGKIARLDRRQFPGSVTRSADRHPTRRQQIEQYRP